MKRYDTYKDSGVQWLGEIPGHWKRTKMKYLASFINGYAFNSDAFRSEGEVPVYRISDIQNDSISTENCVYVQHDEKLVNFEIQDNDLLIAMSGATTGKTGLVEGQRGYINQRVGIIRSNYIHYIKYGLRMPIFLDYILLQAEGSAQPNISSTGISQYYLPLPPLPEQHSIVSYLDDKCGKIDKMVEGKQKQIELLAEMKQRIIADAVTRGLNPDVKMKATNIPWLPEIPEHWEFTRNKSLLKLTDEKVGDRKDITLLSLTKQGVIIRDLSEGKGKFPKDFDTYLVVRPNNLVFCLFDVDETPRTVGLVRNYGMLTGAYTNFEVNETLVLPEYIYNYYLQVDNIKGLRPYYTGLRKVVKTGTFLQIRMPLPPLEEQHAIVSYITDKTTKIDTLTAKLQQEIESIKEYKQRLISDVVTGQIKVC